MHLWQDQAVEAVEMSYKWSSFGEEVGGGSMHSRVEGEAFSIYIPNPGSRTAGALSFFLILSHFCSRWHGPGHYKSPCWNGPINASCPQDRTGTPLCGSCAAGFLQTLGKRKKKSASRCISYSPGNRTANLTPDCQWNNFGSERLPPRSCESHTRPELFEPAGKRSSAELVEIGGLWAAVIFLCFTPRSADSSLVCCTIIAHPVIPGFLVLAKKH